MESCKDRQHIRLFVDMDGTLAEFRNVNTLELLYEKGYFLSLKPQMNVVNAIRRIKMLYPEIEVYILSSVLSDSKYALDEKNMWIDMYLPEINEQHRLFPACGTDKKEVVKDNVSENDYLLDDYSVNLHQWQPPARGIKLLNGINGNNGTWKSDSVIFSDEPEKIANRIVDIINKTDIKKNLQEGDYMVHKRGGIR